MKDKEKKGGRVTESWLRKSRRNILLIVSMLAVLLSSTAAGLAISPFTQTREPDIELNTVENYEFVDKAAYADVLLLESEDGGNPYLNDTLFIGDSNTLRIYMFSLLTLDNVIGVESIGVIGARNNKCVYFEGSSMGVTMAEAVAMMKPRRVILNLGLNDVPSLSTETFIENYRELIQEIRAAYPYTDIIISSVPPFAKKMEGSVLKISVVNEYNRALIDMAREVKVMFLDFNEVLTGEDGYIRSEYSYSDGIHITKDGLKAILKYARTHMYETEDLRPKPLGDIPKQKYVAQFSEGSGSGNKGEEVEPFNATTTATIASGMLVNYGFRAATTEDMTTATRYTYSAPNTTEGGTEDVVAKEIYFYLLSQGLTSGIFKMTSTSDETAYYFTILVKPDGLLQHEHVFGSWTVVTQAQYCLPGEDKRYCLLDGCEHVESQVTPAPAPNDHSFGNWEVETPAVDCTPGLERRTCTRCGHTETQEIPAPNPHSYEPDEEVTPASCIAEGQKKATCSLCRYVRYTTIPKPDHAWSVWTVDFEPGCLLSGQYYRQCANAYCLLREVKSVPALGHVDNNGDGRCDRCDAPHP